MSDLIKLFLTSSDAHLSHSTVLCGLALIPRQDRNSQASPCDGRGREKKRLTGSEAVAAGVALQLLFAVFTVKVIFTS